MQATINRKEFLSALGEISGVCPTRSPKPILANCLFRVDQDGVATISATDLEVSCNRKVMGVTAGDEGSVLIPCAKFQEILAKSPDQEITIDAEGDTLVIRSARAKYKLANEDPELYPAIPGFEAKSYWQVRADDFRKAIRRTIGSTDPESTRYALGGCLFKFDDSTLTIVGTDGRRLAKAEIDSESVNGVAMSTGTPVVPVKALKQIDRALDLPDDATVDIAFVMAGNGLSGVAIRTGDKGRTITSRLVEGRYPRYEDVFPPTPVYWIAMPCGNLRTAVDQAAILTSDESRGISFVFSADKLTLTSQAADQGSSVVVMELDGHEDQFGDQQELTVNIDPRYVVDILKTIGDDEEIVAELIDGKAAVMLRLRDELNFIVMPLLVGQS